MADKHSRNILLYVLLQTLSWIHAMKASLEVVVEGGHTNIECTTNSSLGIDWTFTNATKEYKLSHENVVPDPFKMEYSVKNVDYSSYNIFYLSIARVKISNAGTYSCVGAENQRVLTSVNLALLTIPICEQDVNSTETRPTIDFVCNFSFIGNISQRSQWIGDFCTNSTPTTCSDVNEKDIFCEFPNNRTNRTVLPFAINAASHGIEACEISCKHFNETSIDYLSMSSSISVFLQCRVNYNLTTAKPTTSTIPAKASQPIGTEFYLYGSIAVSSVGVILTIIIIAIFRNTDACSCRKISRIENNTQQSHEEQIDINTIYHELESPYAEIPAELTENTIADNHIEHGSVPNGLYSTNHSHDSVPASRNATVPPIHLDNHQKLLRKDRHEAKTALVSSEYADPFDRVASLPYAMVYKVNANA